MSVLLCLSGCQWIQWQRSRTVAGKDTSWSPDVEGFAESLTAPGRPDAGISAAAICPADSDMFLQANNLAGLRADSAKDPMVRFVLDQVLSRPGWWKRTTSRLGMTEQEVFDTFFGRSIVVMGKKIGRRYAPVVLSRVDQVHTQSLPEKLEWNGLGEAGGFKLYFAGDVIIGFSKRWMVMGEKRDETLLKKLLPTLGQTPALDQHQPFIEAVGRLPRRDGLVFYLRDSGRDETHAAVAVLVNEDQTESSTDRSPRDGKASGSADAPKQDPKHALKKASKKAPKLRIHYAGQVPRFDKLYATHAEAGGIDFGPLPQSTIFATTINAVDRKPKYSGLANTVLFPTSYERDVLPKLSAPVIAFMGTVPGSEIKPDPGFTVPVFGMAIKLRDPSVVGDLDRMMNGLRMLANLSEFQLFKTLFGSEFKQDDKHAYHTSDFGRALVKRIRDPELAALVRLPQAKGLMKLSYGPIGNWYVICTQSAFYRRCIAAHADPKLRLTALAGFEAFQLRERENLVLSSILRAPQLSTLIRELSETWQRVSPSAKGDTPVSKRLDPKKLERPLQWISSIVGHHDSFSVQVWRRELDGSLHGQIDVAR